jgi:hypothetical protein
VPFVLLDRLFQLEVHVWGDRRLQLRRHVLKERLDVHFQVDKLLAALPHKLRFLSELVRRQDQPLDSILPAPQVAVGNSRLAPHKLCGTGRTSREIYAKQKPMNIF